MVELFSGPAPLAQLVHDELTGRGVASELRGTGVGMEILGSVAAPAAFQSVVTTPELAERHQAAIDEVLAMVSEPDTVVEALDEG